MQKSTESSFHKYLMFTWSANIKFKVIGAKIAKRLLEETLTGSNFYCQILNLSAKSELKIKQYLSITPEKFYCNIFFFISISISNLEIRQFNYY